MSAWPGKYVIGLTLFCLVVVAGVFYMPPQITYRGEFKTAEKIIFEVESFRRVHGRLPNTLEDAAIADKTINVYYRRENKDRYIVWFGTTLGESMIYDSDEKRWRARRRLLV